MLRLVLSGLMGALLVVSKQAMSGLPNLEPVSLLIILFALDGWALLRLGLFRCSGPEEIRR